MFDFLRRRKRARLRNKPFPKPWLSLLEHNVAFFHLLDSEDQEELLGDVQIFLAEKYFEGCGGLEVTDQIRLTIAACACLLMINRDFEYFPNLQTILVYPGAYIVPGGRPDQAGVMTESGAVHLGDSWSIGAVILSWEDVCRDAAQLEGHNVVLHEFAHQIDRADGVSDGWPDHIEAELQAPWLEIMSREFEALKAAIREGRPPTIDPYGVKSPAEFFAVLTEEFFTAPASLHYYHRDVYKLFSEFYAQDPLNWRR